MFYSVSPFVSSNLLPLVCTIFHEDCYDHPHLSQSTLAAFNYRINFDKEGKRMLLMSSLKWGRSQGTDISHVHF